MNRVAAVSVSVSVFDLASASVSVFCPLLPPYICTLKIFVSWKSVSEFVLHQALLGRCIWGVYAPLFTITSLPKSMVAISYCA